MCAISGVFILALPVPIVLNRYHKHGLLQYAIIHTACSFSSNYKNKVWRNEVMIRKQVKRQRIREEELDLTIMDRLVKVSFKDNKVDALS